MKNRKKFLLIGITLILLIGIVFILVKMINENKELNYIVIQEDGAEVNLNRELHEEKQIDGFKISNIQFIKKNGQTELIADVTNMTGTNQKGFLANVVLYDEKGDVMAKIPANIIDTQANETIQMRAGITEDYIKAYDFKLEKKYN